MNHAPWPHGDPRTVAQAILREPRYRAASPPPAHTGWWERLIAWLAGLWRHLVAPLHLRGTERVADVIGILVLIAVMCALAATALRFARRFPAAPRARRVPGGVALDDAPDAATLRARALDEAAAGRYRDAAASLWGAALRALEERGRVRYDAARTPGEWRREVRDPAFDALARDAVAALFAGAADAALVVRMREAYDRLVAA